MHRVSWWYTLIRVGVGVGVCLLLGEGVLVHVCMQYDMDEIFASDERRLLLKQRILVVQASLNDAKCDALYKVMQSVKCDT